MLLLYLPIHKGLSSEISESNCCVKEDCILIFLSEHADKSEHPTLTWKVLQNAHFNNIGVIHHKHSVLF